MLTIYSTHGSPGASTTAVYLAAQWASAGQQVLLVEADSASGSLSQKLGVGFTPGTASFVASGKPATAANLIEHAQDVLFSDLHVMPAPSSPSGAKAVAADLAALGDKLRDISDTEMAVIVDGGRLTPDARFSQLTTSAAGVLVVSRNNTQLSSLEHLQGALASSPQDPGPLGFSACIESSPLSIDQWRDDHGLTYLGEIEIARDGTADLSMFLSHGKRKFRKLRNSLERLAGALGESAFPGSTETPRPRLAPIQVHDTGLDSLLHDSNATSDLDGVGHSEPPASSSPASSPASSSPASATDPSVATTPMAPAASAASFDSVPAAAESPQYNQPPPATPQYGTPGHAEPQYNQPPPGTPQYGTPGYGEPQYDRGNPASRLPDDAYGVPDTSPRRYDDPPYAQYERDNAGYPDPGANYPDAYERSLGEAGAGQYRPETPGYAGVSRSDEAQFHEARFHDVNVNANVDAHADSGTTIEVPAQPTGSFRAWAEQLYGDEARSDPAGGWSPPGEGATA